MPDRPPAGPARAAVPRDELGDALADAGGAAAPPAARAQLRRLLLDRLSHGAKELAGPRSGYGLAVAVAIASLRGRLVAVAPVEATLRADESLASGRAWLLTAALVGALVTAGDDASPGEPALVAGAFTGAWLALALPAQAPDADVAACAFDEEAAGIDRLRARAYVLPGHVLDDLEDLRAPVGATHPLRVAEAVARLGRNPADDAAVDELEDAVLPLLGGGRDVTRPHDDPDPRRRVARRILQRMAGMGKWGGYHTEFAHISRGFAGNDRRLAQEIGERLLAAGLIKEKTSVGQRHVFLNPRRAPEIYALVDEGKLPPGLQLD